MVNIGQWDSDDADKNLGGDFEPLPRGWYAMQVVDAEVRTSQNSGDRYLQLELEIVVDHHPQIGARKVWTNLNLWHSNPKAVSFSQARLAKIQDAVGLPVMTDTDELLYKPFAVKLKITPPKDGYDAKNDVADIDAVAARIGAPQSAPETPPPPPQPGQSAPWKR